MKLNMFRCMGDVHIFSVDVNEKIGTVVSCTCKRYTLYDDSVEEDA